MSCCQILDTALQLSATQHCTPPLRGASHLLRNTVFRAHSLTLAQRDFYRARAYFTVYFTQNKKEKKIDKDFRTLQKITLPDPRFFWLEQYSGSHRTAETQDVYIRLPLEHFTSVSVYPSDTQASSRMAPFTS